MAYKITADCLKCGACEAECPNQAITEGDATYVVDQAKCTECVGFLNAPNCGLVCSVEAPGPDPNARETREALLAKFQRLHPGVMTKGFILTADKSKPVIALVADGSGDPAGQKALENLDTFIRGRFPGYDVCWAVMAQYMIEGLRRRGQTTFYRRRIPVYNADELLARLAAEGVRKVAMQLLMMHESSFSRTAMAADKRGMEIKYALPFLSTAENLAGVVKALAPGFGDGKETATVLIGHGVLKDFEQNNCFLEMNKYVGEHHNNVYVGTLHGPPGWDHFVKAIKASGCRKVRFISLMMTTSEHISQDVMGDGPESWKSMVGLPADALDNLTENPMITDFFAKSIEKLVR